MPTPLRHLVAILLLPVNVVVVVPYVLLKNLSAADTRWTATLSIASLHILVGAAVFLTGFALFAWCVGLFARFGRGTLAPWDPPRVFVAHGPYRHMRNPMITGVVAMLFGEALLWGSVLVVIWASIFLLINHTYFILLEEPGLERRFGESYRVYKANVPRWIPRIQPWMGVS